jgi:hypothetical protein
VSGEDDDGFAKVFGRETVEPIEIGAIDAVRVPFKMVREALGDEANEIDRELLELFTSDPLDELKATAKRLGYDGTERDGVIDVAMLLNGGQARNRDDAADLFGSLLFAARAFARLDRKVRAARKAGDTKRAVSLGVEMGRLVEWWRWRGSGLDKEARTRKAAVRAFLRKSPERDVKNAECRAKAQEWREQARAIAAKSKSTGDHLFGQVQRELKKVGIEKSPRSIRRALSERS